MNVALITLGDPGRRSGGYRYHRRMAEAAGQHRATLEFCSVPDGRALTRFASVPRILRRAARADVVVVDGIVAAPLAPWLRRFDLRPVVAVAHQSPGGVGGGGLAAAFDRSAYRSARVVIASSELLRAELEEGGVAASKIRVVEPGSDLPASDAEVGDLRQGRRVAVLCVANWLPGKDLLSLLEAIARLVEDMATLHLVGDPDADAAYGSQVRARLDRIDLAGRVVVHGVVADRLLAPMYAAADLFALASRQESYGIAWAEALRAGLPVVGWRIPALENLVEHGKHGFLADLDDVDGLSRGIERLAQDGERRTMGQEAKRRGESLPTWDETARGFFDVLREAVG